MTGRTPQVTPTPRTSARSARQLDRVRPNVRGQDGLTLVELMAVVLIFGVVGTMLASSFISAQSTARTTNSLAIDVTEARASMVEVSRVVRTARPHTVNAPLPFEDASADQLTFYANFRSENEPGPKLIRLTLEGDAFVEYIQPATASPDAPGFVHADVMDGRRRVLANNVTSSSVFVYTNRDGAEVDPSSLTADPVARVEVRLEIGGPPLRPNPTVVQQTIRLPNILRS